MAGKSQVARRLAMMLTLLLLPPLLTRPLVGSAQMLSWEPPLTASEMAAGPIKEPLLPPPPLQPTVQHVQRQASSMCASRPWLPDGQELGAFAMPESYVELSTVSAETLVKCRLVTANKHALLHPAANPVALVNPLWLMTPSRFDLLAKYVYARDRRLGRRSKWGLRLYLSHIGVWNGFEEHDPPQPRKSGPVAFLLAFDRLIDGQRTSSQSGAAIASTLVPLALDNSAVSSPASDMHGASRQPFGNAQRTVSGGAGVRGGVAIVDGAHRLAAAAVFGVPLLTVRVGGPPAADYGAEFFRQRGMPRSYLDAMALTWAQLHRHAARVVLLWPTLSRSPSALNTSLQELRARGQLVYVRRLDGADSPWGGSISDGRADAHPEGSGGASSDGALLLLRTLYGSEEWLGSSADGFAGARAKAARCFGKQPGGALHVIVYAAHAQKQLPPLHQQQNRDSSSSASVRRAAEAEGGVSWATRQAKEAVRRLPAVLQTGGGTGQDAVHASDTARETESLLALLLTEPGRQLLRNLREPVLASDHRAWLVNDRQLALPPL
eukprot:SAG25_NODE_817_length_5224_cov_27.176780_2_plen_551_part_00